MMSKGAKMKFKDLQVGETFDFVSPKPELNSFTDRCVKMGKRQYGSLKQNKAKPVQMFGYDIYAVYNIGTTNAEVYNVGENRE
jgi:hypothetical protein